MLIIQLRPEDFRERRLYQTVDGEKNINIDKTRYT